MPYVVYGWENMRDGREEFARVVPDLKEAEALIDKYANSFGGCNSVFKLFKLGEEIPVHLQTVEEPQPTKKSVKCRIVPADRPANSRDRTRGHRGVSADEFG